MSTAIALRGITKTFGDTTVLQNLDLEVSAGGVLALLGPNGAGKTTTIGILSTLVLPDSGTATVCGYDVVREADAVRRVISVTGQSSAVDGVLTGRENLRMMARLGGLGRTAARPWGTRPAPSPTPARPCCSPRSISRRPTVWPTASRYSNTGRSWPTAP